MGPSDLLRLLSQTCDTLGIPYRVTGSVASIVYGEPRLTIDIDVVVRMQPHQVADFCAAFAAPEFYCSLQAAAEAVRQRFQFNILHPESGLKIDVMVASESDFDASRFSRGQRIKTAADQEAWFASAEDVILKKLEYYGKGGSDKHLRDIIGMLKVQGAKIDRAYIVEWATRLGVEKEWDIARRAVPGAEQGGPAALP